LQRGWRRYRRLPAAFQVLIVLAVVALYSGVLIVAVGGGSGGDKVTTVVSGGKARRLTAFETKVKKLVTDAKLFQREQTDVGDFRRPRVYSIRCEERDCSVAYAVAVPGRGRIIFQQLEMARTVFGKTDVAKLSIKVTRSIPSGPAASPPSAEETLGGTPLLQTVCERKNLPSNANWGSQKEGQAILEHNCQVGPYNQAAGGQGGNQQGPRDSPKSKDTP
jgi:hypothetical protein